MHNLQRILTGDKSEDKPNDNLHDSEIQTEKTINEVDSKEKSEDNNNKSQVCWFGKKCFREQCKFLIHDDTFSPSACRFKKKCRKKDCLYKHPDDCKDRDIDECKVLGCKYIHIYTIYTLRKISLNWKKEQWILKEQWLLSKQ